VDLEPKLTNHIREAVIVFVTRIVMLMFLSTTILIVSFIASNQGYIDSAILSLISISIFILTMISLISAVLKWYFNYYYFTDNELVYKTGILSFAEKSVMFKEVESVTVSLSLFGRIFNYGNVSISGDTDKSTLMLRNISNPRETGEQVEDLTAINLKLKKLTNE